MSKKFYLAPLMAATLSLAACAGGTQCLNDEGFERTAGAVSVYPADTCPGQHVAPEPAPAIKKADPVFEKTQRK